MGHLHGWYYVPRLWLSEMLNFSVEYLHYDGRRTVRTGADKKGHLQGRDSQLIES